MALELRNNFSEEESVKMRFEALKEAGFDEDTANKLAPKSRSVNEAIDHILSTSLTSDQLSSIRASYTQSLTNNNNNNNNNHFSNPTIDSRFSSMSGISSFNGNKNLNNIFGANQSRGTDGTETGSESLGLKLISDIDNCLGSILDSDEEKPKFFEEKTDNNMISATNTMNAINTNPTNFSNNNTNSFINNNFCDSVGDNGLLSRSLSPQMPSQNVFGISTDPLVKPVLQKANIFSNFSIDLNKELLGSTIATKTGHSSTGGEPPRKTWSDIASANTKKPVQPMKTSITPKSIQKSEIKTQKVLDSGNKLSSLESFGGTAIDFDKFEKINSIVLSSEPTRPTNLMGYKGLWVCNISPNTSYITLKNVFRKYGNFTGIQTFERKATNGSNIVFVHYDNSQSPTEAIAELFGIYRKDICFDEDTLLKLRYTPSMEQTKNGDLPSMEKARRIVEKSGECFNWRLSTGCHKGERCAFKHIPINKAVDSQPWVRRNSF